MNANDFTVNLSVRSKKAAPQKQKYHKRRVTFTQPLIKIFPQGDCSKDDKAKCWLSKQDYKTIQLERRRSLRALGKADFDSTRVDPEEYCSFGLEQLQSIQHLNLFKARQAAVVQAVLAEQKFQKTVGRPDPVAIQMISVSFSRDSAEAACQRAARYRTDIVRQEEVTPSVDSDEENNVLIDRLPITRVPSMKPLMTVSLKRPRVVWA